MARVNALAPQINQVAQRVAARYGLNATDVANRMKGIVYQESRGLNRRVHDDGTGHGLIGLDDHGLMGAFERATGQTYGRGANASTIPTDRQLGFLGDTLGARANALGSLDAAVREWHTGPSNRNGTSGRNYQGLIDSHVRNWPADAPTAIQQQLQRDVFEDPRR